MQFHNPDLRLKRIIEIIEEIYIIACDRTKWYLDSKITERLRWLRNLEDE